MDSVVLRVSGRDRHYLKQTIDSRVNDRRLQSKVYSIVQ